MRNVTVTLEEDVARWARLQAAERNTSVSRLLGELLREKMGDEQQYRRAERDFFAEPATPISDGTTYPDRNERNERRPRLR